MTHVRSILKLLMAALAVSLVGCSSYIPPGAKADLQALAPPSVQEGFNAKPTAPFPAGIAFVRIQSPSYSNYGLRQANAIYGSGRYSVVLTREVEDEALLDRVAHLPQVAGITGLNRMLLPERLDNELQIREAASRVQADLVFLYTFDTAFYRANTSTPLAVISLGMASTAKVTVSTTVSALLLDTRTGYIYSTYETTKKAETMSSAWSSEAKADETRRQNEREAFSQMVDDVTKSWPRLLERYTKKS